MPANVTREYLNAELKYRRAGTMEEKLAALQEMLSTIPKHKGTEVMRAQIKERMKRIRREAAEAKKRRKGRSLAIKKEGFQIAIIGFPNTGKSTLLSRLTNARPKISDYPFTTKEPEVGIMDFEGGQIQLVEIPALIEKASEKQRDVLTLLSGADGIILLADDEHQRKTLVEELKKFGIDRPVFYASKRETITPERLFEFFDLIRVYTKEPGEKPEEERPIILKKNTTVLDVAKEIHKDFAENLKFAKVWGSSRFPGQRVEKDYVLGDKDIVELHI
jgi:ribosome-interacting GTPase 1